MKDDDIKRARAATAATVVTKTDTDTDTEHGFGAGGAGDDDKKNNNILLLEEEEEEEEDDDDDDDEIQIVDARGNPIVSNKKETLPRRQQMTSTHEDETLAWAVHQAWNGTVTNKDHQPAVTLPNQKDKGTMVQVMDEPMPPFSGRTIGTTCRSDGKRMGHVSSKDAPVVPSKYPNKHIRLDDDENDKARTACDEALAKNLHEESWNQEGRTDFHNHQRVLLDDDNEIEVLAVVPMKRSSTSSRHPDGDVDFAMALQMQEDMMDASAAGVGYGNQELEERQMLSSSTGKAWKLVHQVIQLQKEQLNTELGKKLSNHQTNNPNNQINLQVHATPLALTVFGNITINYSDQGTKQWSVSTTNAQDGTSTTTFTNNNVTNDSPTTTTSQINNIAPDIVSVVAMDDMVAMAEKFLETLESFAKAGKSLEVDIGYHWTQAENLSRIQTDGLLTKAERDERSIQSNYNGSSLGDGIYTANDPFSCSNTYGPICIMVARLKGTLTPKNNHRPPRQPAAVAVAGVTSNQSIDTVVGANGLVHVLKTSGQCLPLLYFSQELIRPDDATWGGNLFVHECHVKLQQILQQRIAILVPPSSSSGVQHWSKKGPPQQETTHSATTRAPPPPTSFGIATTATTTTTTTAAAAASVVNVPKILSRADATVFFQEKERNR